MIPQVFDSHKNKPTMDEHGRKRPGTEQERQVCDHCGWSYPLHQLHRRDGSGWICLACLEFLETGEDPRPWCVACGRSLPEGQLCTCDYGMRQVEDLITEIFRQGSRDIFGPAEGEEGSDR